MRNVLWLCVGMGGLAAVGGCWEEVDCAELTCSGDQVCEEPWGCITPCEGDEDCGEREVCDTLYTTHRCEKGCRRHDQCPADQACFVEWWGTGECDDGCRVDADCGDAEYCGWGTCSPRCGFHGQCAEGEYCKTSIVPVESNGCAALPAPVACGSATCEAMHGVMDPYPGCCIDEATGTCGVEVSSLMESEGPHCAVVEGGALDPECDQTSGAVLGCRGAGDTCGVVPPGEPVEGDEVPCAVPVVVSGG